MVNTNNTDNTNNTNNTDNTDNTNNTDNNIANHINNTNEDYEQLMQISIPSSINDSNYNLIKVNKNPYTNRIQIIYMEFIYDFLIAQMPMFRDIYNFIIGLPELSIYIHLQFHLDTYFDYNDNFINHSNIIGNYIIDVNNYSINFMQLPINQIPISQGTICIA